MTFSKEYTPKPKTLNSPIIYQNQTTKNERNNKDPLT